MEPANKVVAVVGGTGKEGFGLAVRLGAAGCDVLIGSRDEAAATDAAARVAQALAAVPGARLPEGRSNFSAASAADLVFLCVPYAAHAPVLRELKPVLAGKIVVDVVVPLGDPLDVAWRPEAGSAAQEAAQILGADSFVVGAFHNVSATRLARLGQDVGCDVLVCGDDADARDQVIRLAQRIGVTAIDAGALANAPVVEGLTAVLLGINRRYGAKGAGVRVTHLPS